MKKLISYGIFPFDVLVLSNTNLKRINTTLKEKLPIDCHKEIKAFKGDYDARTVMFSNGATCIVFNKMDKGTIAHEAFHAIAFLFDRIGIKFSLANDEIYAYTLQYLINKINGK